MKGQYLKEIEVLILVLMEDALRDLYNVEGYVNVV